MAGAVTGGLRDNALPAVGALIFNPVGNAVGTVLGHFFAASAPYLKMSLYVQKISASFFPYTCQLPFGQHLWIQLGKWLEEAVLHV